VTKRRQKNTTSARLLRRATAYARLAAKAQRNGQSAEWYWKMETRLREQAARARAREEERRG